MTGKRNLWSGAAYLALLFLMWTLPATVAKNLPIAWDPNTEPDLAGYHVYYGELNEAPHRLTVSSATATLAGLTPGRSYSIYVTAFNNLGVESAPSEAIIYTVPADSLSLSSIEKLDASSISVIATGFPGKIYQVEASSDLRSPEWEPLGTASANQDGQIQVIDTSARPMRFYRIVEVTADWSRTF